ncbi:MAG: phage major capsid protein, partial [Actinomycetota bacterium]|nr:phage major capsid protein [Actinomycetota bacterium]
TYVSNEIQEDALIPIIDDVVMAFGRGFAAKEDDCLFNGDGTSSFGGIVGIRTLMIDGNHNGSFNEAAGDDDQWPEYIDTDLIGMMGETPFQGDEFDDEKWYCSKIAAYQTFGRLLRAAGGVQLAALAGAIPLFYGGAPVVISQKMPKVTTALNQVVVFIYGNMRQAVTFADRRGITVALDTSVKFISDQIAIKASERFDIKVHSIGDGTNAGPLFGLRGNTS